MVSTKLPGTSQSRDAGAIMKALLERAREPDQPALRALFSAAAGADGNRHLDAAEAGLIKDAFEAGRTPNGYDLDAIRARAMDAIQQRLKSRDADGIRAYFTSTTPNINRIIIQEMRDTVAAAKGKPVEFNIMIFNFVDPEIGDAMRDLAQGNANVTFRLVADFDQLADAGHRQPSRLAKLGLPNLGVKFKKDAPYVWDPVKKMPKYDHNATKGLVHHKGFVALVDGRPVKLVTGSYNWSPTADDKNYENLFVVDGSNPANRLMLASYQAEFVALFNHADALNYGQAKAFKTQVFNALRVAHGLPAMPVPDAPPADPPYVPRAPATRFDLNFLSDENHAKLRGLLRDSRLLSSVVSQYARYGRIASFENLLERVPALKKLSEARLAELSEAFEFGDGRVPINLASADELVRSLRITKPLALAIVAQRAAVGDFESIAELKGLPGMTDAIFARIAPRLSDDVSRSFFSAHPFDEASARRGYDADNNARKYPLMGADGVIADRDASLSSGVTDLLQRAKAGDTAKIAMYGMSITTAEYAAIVEAAGRGVHVQVILNDDFNEGAAAALNGLGARGLPVEARIQKARTMHEKFGVVNDDCFNGSANFSGSSAEKHAEDRFVIKNDPELAADLNAEFDLIWGRSRPA